MSEPKQLPGEQPVETELRKKAGDMVESMFTMPGLAQDPVQGNSYYNNLERHTRVRPEHLLYSVLLGTLVDLPTAYQNENLKSRVDLAKVMWGRTMTHLYQANISMNGEGRKEGVQVITAVASDRHDLATKGSRLAGLRQALTGKK
jgi:hypothetical protein